MAGLSDPIPLVIGGLFGMGGYIVAPALNALLAFGSPDAPSYLTDTVALTVGLSAIAVRLMFGTTGLFGSLSPEAREQGRFRPGGTQVWVIHQQGFVQATVLGVGAGLLSGYGLTAVAGVNQDLVASVTPLMFGVSAVSLILLQFGLPGPVTHHMTLPGAVAAAGVIVAGGPGGLALLAGVAAGIAGALLEEFYSRLFLIHGDTHVDPPAFAIATMATVVILIRIFTGTV